MSLKNKIIVLFTLSLSVLLGGSLYVMYGTVRDELLRENLQNLLGYSRIMISVFEEGGIPKLREAVEKLSGWPGRVTFIDLNGKVAYDSSKIETDNHLTRPEIRRAAESGSGSALRYSQTLRSHMHYYAVRVSGAEQSGYIRVAYPLALLTSILAALFKKILFYVLLIALLVTIIWVWLAKRIFVPLEQIVRKAEQTESSEVKFPFFKDTELQKLSVALNDMSARLQQADRNIQARREELAHIVESLPIGVVLIDHNRALRYLNSVARNLLGGTGDISKGTPVERLLPNGEIYDMLSDPDGSRTFFLPYHEGTWVEIAASTLGNSRLLILKDMTEYRRLEEARRNFIVEAGHDLQTPLTSIRAAAELLLENADEEDARLLRTLVRQQERMTSLIDDLLLLVKLDAESVKEERGEEDLAELLKILMDGFKEDPAAQGLAFEVALPERAPVYAVRSEILRAFSNVVDNAVRKCNEKWQEKTGGRISLTLSSENGKWVVVAADNGPGVSPETEDRIFESFYSASGGGKWGSSGHGLGLSIAARVLKAHGGGIELMKTSPLGGAAFRITLPMLQ